MASKPDKELTFDDIAERDPQTELREAMAELRVAMRELDQAFIEPLRRDQLQVLQGGQDVSAPSGHLSLMEKPDA